MIATYFWANPIGFMSKLKCILIEDEEIAQNGFRKYLEQINFIEITGIASTIEEAEMYHRLFTIDVQFVNLELFGCSTISFLQKFRNTKTIVVSGYTSVELSHYGIYPVDFLQKPVSFEQFSESCLMTYKKHLEILR